MKIKFQVNSGCEIEQEVRDTKEAFAFIAYAQDIFGVKKCGNCGSPHIKLQYREPQGYQYYSVLCQDCKHELKFGQQKESGRLFPKGWEPSGYGQDNDDKPVRRRRSKPQYHDQEDDNEQGYEPRARSRSEDKEEFSTPW